MAAFPDDRDDACLLIKRNDNFCLIDVQGTVSSTIAYLLHEQYSPLLLSAAQRPQLIFDCEGSKLDRAAETATHGKKGSTNSESLFQLFLKH